MAQLGTTSISGDLGVTGITSSKAFYATSDARLKKNIKPYEGNSSIIDLNVYEYDFIDDGHHTIGCMAQELQKICPDIVHEVDGVLKVDESKIVYLLLLEVQRLRRELDDIGGQLK